MGFDKEPAMRKQRHTTKDVIECPMEAALDLIGGKWKGVILFRIAEQTRRFNELHRLVCKISARMLTKQLRELEADGLVSRTVYAEVPPRVEYALTPKGQSLTPVLKTLMDWGEAHALPAIETRQHAK
jgi:DNA-binding HxlR family transcriptional regulator